MPSVFRVDLPAQCDLVGVRTPDRTTPIMVRLAMLCLVSKASFIRLVIVGTLEYVNEPAIGPPRLKFRPGDLDGPPRKLLEVVVATVAGTTLTSEQPSQGSRRRAN
jgi:hypothetical protein